MSRAIERQSPKRGPAVQKPSDEELLLRHRNQGDRSAFETLVHRYERELYSYLRRYTGDADLAEDVFQATFFQLHQKAHLYEAGRPVRPWLYTIATHQAVDALRKAGRHQAVSLDARSTTGEIETDALVNLLSAETPTPGEEMEEAERREWVRREIERLPEHLRRVVLLTYYQGLKYREVAEILGIPVGTMKSRLHTALGRLGAAWKRRERTD